MQKDRKNRQIATHVGRQTDGQADRNTFPLELTTLGWPIRLVLKQLLWDPPSVNALSFNALIFSILRIVCTISFHYSCPWIFSMSFTAFNSPAWKGLTSWLSVVVSTVSLSLPIGILGQVWYLIVPIPECCTLTYFHSCIK